VNVRHGHVETQGLDGAANLVQRAVRGLTQFKCVGAEGFGFFSPVSGETLR